MEPYLRLFSALEKSEFSLSDVQTALKTTLGSAKVIVSRLKRAGQLFPVGKGKFVMMRPQNHVQLRLLKAKNPRLYRLASEIYSRFPLLRMLVLFGSQLTGETDKFSDFDVLLVLPSPLENREEVGRDLEEKLKIKLHFTAYSEYAYRIFLYSEAHVRLWLSNGMIFDETSELSKLAPPVARRAFMEEIFTALTFLRVSRIDNVRTKKADYIFKALRILAIVHGMLCGDYDYSSVRKTLYSLLGETVVSKIRNSRPLTDGEFKSLSKACSGMLGRVRAKLKLMGDNSSDIIWNKALEEKLKA